MPAKAGIQTGRLPPLVLGKQKAMVAAGLGSRFEALRTVVLFQEFRTYVRMSLYWWYAVGSRLRPCTSCGPNGVPVQPRMSCRKSASY